MDILHMKISKEFEIDHCLTFLNFWTSWRSSCLFTAIAQAELYTYCCMELYTYCWIELHASCCNFTGRVSTPKFTVKLRVSDISDVYFYMNVHPCPHTLTPSLPLISVPSWKEENVQELLVPPCNSLVMCRQI